MSVSVDLNGKDTYRGINQEAGCLDSHGVAQNVKNRFDCLIDILLGLLIYLGEFVSSIVVHDGCSQDLKLQVALVVREVSRVAQGKLKTCGCYSFTSMFVCFQTKSK